MADLSRPVQIAEKLVAREPQNAEYLGHLGAALYRKGDLEAAGVAFEEVARRHGDFAIVGLAVSLTLTDDVISDARLAFAGVSDVPVRATEAEDLLVGERPSAELFEEAARVAAAGIDPPADLNGSSEYRKKVAAALVRRGLQAAADNAYERQ